MGYRIYLGRITKKELKEIENISSTKELWEYYNPNKEHDPEDDYVGGYDLGDNYLHEFGKYIEWTSELREECSEDIFKNEELNKYMTQENDLFLINKKGLEYIIEEYFNEMKDFYTEKKHLAELQLILLKQQENIERAKEIYVEAYKYISQTRYTKYDFEELSCYSYEELWLVENTNKRFSILENISKKFYDYFHCEQSDYKWKFYNLDESNPFKITNSCKKDKNILELVHIYKTFDFEKNSLMIYGY